jgi:hypothetical protein
MAITFDLGARFKAAFGYAADNQSASLESQNFMEANGITDVGIYVSDASFEEMTLKQGNDEVLAFGSMMFNKNANGSIYAPPPMLSFNKSKNLTITEIDGADAEVVERYGDRSWEIGMDGILIDMVNHRYPKGQVIQLRQSFDTKAPWAVEGEMFDDLGIKSIYFTSVKIGGVAGYEDTIQYSLQARSIKPAQFFFANKNNR